MCEKSASDSEHHLSNDDIVLAVSFSCLDFAPRCAGVFAHPVIVVYGECRFHVRGLPFDQFAAYEDAIDEFLNQKRICGVELESGVGADGYVDCVGSLGVLEVHGYHMCGGGIARAGAAAFH